MKRIFAIAMICLAVLLSQISAAEEPATINLAAPVNLISEACKVPLWNNLNVVWHGVKDVRPEKEIGTQTQSGKDPIPVLSAPPIEEVFDANLKKLLTACGMKLKSGEDPNALQLSAEVRVFYVGVEKKLITGKSISKSKIAFLSRRGGESLGVTVGTELEKKKVRSGSIKQLTSSLNDLFVETLKQIPTTQEMRDLK